jgi:hypothetical protein
MAGHLTALTGSRADTYLVQFQVDTVLLGPAWDVTSGWAVDSEEGKYRPGGMDMEVSLGGRITYDNITVSRIIDEYMVGMHAWLITRVGKARVYIVRYPLTADWVQLGRGVGAQGTLKRVAWPDYDSNGGSDAALVECECTIDRYWS